MVKNLTLLFIGILFSITAAFSQAGISCDDTETMPLCDLDDINGAIFTNPPPGGAVPADALCTDGGAFHNPGWFSFVAGSTDINLTVIPQPMTCDTTAGGLTGVQVALWEGCPDSGGNCVAGNADCNDTPIDLEATDLTIGETYNLVIDGCGGSVCTVEVMINSASAFELPDLSDVDLADPEYDRRTSCNSILEDEEFCANLDVLFSIDDDFYDNLGAEYEWTITGPDPSTVEWNFGSYSGTGNPVNIGDLNGELGADGVSMNFETPGIYTICAVNVATECDANAAGEACIEVTIIGSGGEQDFGQYDVCVLDLLAGWQPDGEDNEGNVWVAGDITLSDVEGAEDGIIEINTSDDCGCDFTQIVQITPRGSIDREEVELYVWECMLEYEWFELSFDDFNDLPEGLSEDLSESSAESDWEGTNCDSLISLTVTPLTVIDTVIVGDCTSNGTEFSFEFTFLDPDGNEVPFINPPSITWLDANTMAEVANTQTALLNSGSYLVSFEGDVTDLNYIEPNLANIGETAPCELIFGPFDLVGGSSTEPNINPYDQVYCNDELNLLTFTLDTLPDTDYTWVIPPSYNVLINQEDSLAVSIPTYVETDTLFVFATNGCGSSDSIPLPISVVPGPAVATDGAPTNCEGQEYLVGYMGDASLISSYAWDTPGGTITTGTASDQNIGITYPAAGSYDYTLVVTDLDNCTSSETFSVTIEENLENPMVMCNGNSSEIIFTWNDVIGATSYNIIEVDLPAGSVGTLTGTTYTITNVTPGAQATIQVQSLGATSCIETALDVTCFASACDLSGVVNVNFNDIEFCEGMPPSATVQFQIDLPVDYTGTYMGPGITVDGELDLNSVDLVTGVNTLSYSFTDVSGNCTGDFSADVIVNATPVSQFVPSETEFCLGEFITLTGVGAGATWDFGADAIGDETNLSYSTSGMKTISVAVVDAVTNCMSDFTLDVNVLDTIATPLVTCASGTDAVNFDWQDIAGASSYDISYTINGGAAITDNITATDLMVPSLMEGDEVILTLTVSADNGCNTQQVSLPCQAITCLVPVIDLSTDQTIFCSNDILNTQVPLVALVDGNAPDPGTFSWTGTGVTSDMNGATFDIIGLPEGMYAATFSYTSPVDGCITTGSLDFEVITVPTPDFTILDSEICVDEIVSIDFANTPPNVTNNNWNFGGGVETFPTANSVEVSYDLPGVYDIALTYSVDNCPEETVIQQVTVNDTIQAPIISCEAVDTDFIQFGWQDQSLVQEYEVYIDGMLVSTQAESEYLLTGLSSGEMREIRVVAIEPNCGNREATQMCQAQECFAPTWTIDVPATQCYQVGSGPINLNVSAVSQNPNSTFTVTWLESEVDDNGNFTPEDGTMDYAFTAVFTEGNCVFDTLVEFRIDVEPVAQLSLIGDPIICEGGSVRVESAFAGVGVETANWNFDGGTETGSGFGPYDVQFDTPGTYNITLEVDNAGCVSPTETVTVTVEQNLVAPTVTCNSNDINTIDVSWDAVDCAGEYNVIVDGNVATTTSATSFTVTGLQENQEVEIMVEAISACACDNVMSAPTNCSSKPCDPTTWSFNNNTLTDVCLDATAQPFQISATPDDLVGNGTGTWSGDPISDQSGTVDPSLVTAGTYDLVYTYEEGGCTYVAPTQQITFVDEPSLSLEAMDPAYPDDLTGVITAEGSGGASGYTYAIDGGIAQASGVFQDVAIGPHSIEIVDANGCINTASINILSPQSPSAEISGPQTIIIENDGTFTLDVQGTDMIDNIIWRSNGQIVCEGVNCTTYTAINALADFDLEVEVIYNGGCSVFSAIFPVNVREIQAFYIPNMVAFGAEGVNSDWKIFIKGNETFPRSIKIYDRWGNLVHENIYQVDTPQREVELWDGFSGDNVPMTGVYVYVLEIDIEDRKEFIGGDLTILR